MTDARWAEPFDPTWAKSLAHRDRREYLDAVDGERRTLRLRLVSPVLLRKPDRNRTQVKRMRYLAKSLGEQVHDQMRAKRRRRFRSPVAVRIELHATALDQPPGTPPSVKAYLDLLQGLVYDDDRHVHLVHASRHASDNPILRDQNHGWVWDAETPRFPVGPEDGVEAVIEVQPIRLYAAGYDALWRRRDDVFDRWSSSSDHDAEGHEVFASDGPDEVLADDQLDDLRQEQRDDLADVGALYGPGGVYDRDDHGRALRQRSRVMREQQIRSLENRFLLAQRVWPEDRPGPPPLSPFGEAEPYAWLRQRRFLLLGVLDLPLPSQTLHPSDYARSVERLLHDHAQRFTSVAAFSTPLALDIAVRQPPEGRKDLDNLAHVLMAPYERLFCGGAQGTIASYRVYLSETGPPGVRVLVMTDARLEALPRAIASTRRWILAERPHLRD